MIFAGHGLVVRQFRRNEECGVLEELEPIDENRRYDFNYQQVTHLPRRVQILPVRDIGFTIIWETLWYDRCTITEVDVAII